MNKNDSFCCHNIFPALIKFINVQLLLYKRKFFICSFHFDKIVSSYFIIFLIKKRLDALNSIRLNSHGIALIIFFFLDISFSFWFDFY